MAFLAPNNSREQMHKSSCITTVTCEPEPELDNRIDLRLAGRNMSAPEIEACRNSIRQSKHSKIQVLPNHALDNHGRIVGFCFECSDEDKASILPMHEHCFEMTAVYEVQRDTRGFDPHALRIISNLTQSRQIIQDIADELCTKNMSPAMLDSMGAHTAADDPYSMMSIQDQKAWSESPPFKMGIYHTFTRAGLNSAERGHRTFVVVTGCLRHAAEELYNLWQDCGEHLTCRQFCEAQEVSWLRAATIRNLNRIAHCIAQRFALNVQEMIDIEDPTNTKLMAIPTLVSTHHDIECNAGRTRVVNSACLTERSGSGIIFDLFSSEGYWIYMGPTDHADYSLFGSMIAANDPYYAFPTRTVCYNVHYPVTTRTNVVTVDIEQVPEVVAKNRQTLDYWLPDEQFQMHTENLGFNRNNGIVALIPIICYDATETQR